MTAIYYLLQGDEVSAWHRIDATEIWHFYDGAPLQLSIKAEDGAIKTHNLGNDVVTGEEPHFTIPPFVWQNAVSLGDWSLVGCTVAPGFEFEGFEMAPDGVLPED